MQYEQPLKCLDTNGKATKQKQNKIQKWKGNQKDDLTKYFRNEEQKKTKFSTWFGKNVTTHLLVYVGTKLAK